ncbi:MAG: VPLPA-CTERM sorting domain-containing protein [Methylococcaceae bacterium]|nr:VPLPA-CTERM sorting domain-containing protein [Methylococcaceae bacterium]MDP3903782.1 VPLPA-CTERM sorting domain-containing protein [Methylococcaceae bacterium]
MTILRTTIATILAGTALAGVSTQASAVSVTGSVETFNAAHTITNSAGTVAIGTSLNNAGGHILTAGASQSAIYHDYTTVKSWADMSIDLGWMHNVDWVQVNVTDTGTYKIKSEILGFRNVAGSANSSNATTTTTYTPMVQDKSIHPAFSIWSLAGNTFTSTGSSNNPTTVQSPLAYGYTTGGNNNTMGFNQVAAPNGTNNASFLTAGGVNGFVGYSNSGTSGWYNGNGDLVGAGSPGASSGTNADGFLWTDLTLNLSAGSYLLAIGGSCVDLVNCGPYQTKTVTTLATGAQVVSKAYGTGWHELTVTAVPVPGAVWLFGSALAGFAGMRRRKSALAA